MKINEKIQEDEKKQSDVLKKYGRKDRHFRQRIICVVILLVLSAFFMILSALIPDFAEWYSEHVYPVWVSTLGRFFRFVSIFFVGDSHLFSSSCLCRVIDPIDCERDQDLQKEGKIRRKNRRRTGK